MTATVEQMREKSLTFVIVHDVPADWILPRTFHLADHSGLIFCQTLTTANGSPDLLLSAWRSKRAFTTSEVAFTSAAGTGNPVHQWHVRAQKLPGKTFLERFGMRTYAGLATLVAVLGCFRSLPEHVQSLMSGAQLELHAAPCHLVLGGPGNAALSVRNVQWKVPTFVHLEAPVSSDIDILEVERMSTAFIPELGSGSSEEVRFEVRAKRPGNCTLRITCHGKAGFFYPRQTFTTTVPVTVWRRLDAKLVPAEISGETVLKFVIFAGEAQPNGVDCDLAIIGGGMKVAHVAGRDIASWSDPIVGESVEITQWNVPSLPATSIYSGTVRLRSTDSVPLTIARLEASIASGQLELRTARRL